MLFLPCLLHATSHKWISFGPMLHWNIGNGKKAPSLALEFAYWNYPHHNTFYGDPTGMGYGLDMAADWELTKSDGHLYRLYTEAQVGKDGTKGGSLGPVLEFTSGSPFHIGVQSSVWVCWLQGADARIRYINGNAFLSPGFFGKVALGPDGPPGRGPSSGPGLVGVY